MMMIQKWATSSTSSPIDPLQQIGSYFIKFINLGFQTPEFLILTHNIERNTRNDPMYFSFQIEYLFSKE